MRRRRVERDANSIFRKPEPKSHDLTSIAAVNAESAQGRRRGSNTRRVRIKVWSERSSILKSELKPLLLDRRLSYGGNRCFFLLLIAKLTNYLKKCSKYRLS
jgi:hypothetical protein